MAGLETSWGTNMRCRLLKISAFAITAAGFCANPAALAQNRDTPTHPAMMAAAKTGHAKSHADSMQHGSPMSAMSHASAMHNGAKPQ